MCEDNEQSEGMILSIGEDGVGELHKQEDYVQIHKDDLEKIKRYFTIQDCQS